ncbi:MAG TPA: hypothetical protein VHU80_05050 [Polyangiaceae bacterium]|jgi:hypothetical protein|nr:hypothetical protein [Polyangiaceae bacterium]
MVTRPCPPRDSPKTSRISITIEDSTTQRNPRGTFETPDLPGFYVIAKQPANVIDSQILR